MVTVADKVSIPTPTVIVKAAGARYEGLCANEWMCLTAARCAGMAVPDFALADDAMLLLIDRFDITPQGHRLGFEDVAAIMQLRVRDRLSSRKYIGSYEDVATALQLVCTDAPTALRQFFDFVVLGIMVRNGDAHLKNFGVLYQEPAPGATPEVWLSPIYDQVTTTIYTFERPGGVETVDHTMALKLRRGQRSGDRSPARSYPLRAELERFGHDVCGVQVPSQVIQRISDAMSQALQLARRHGSIGADLFQRMETVWDAARVGF